MNENFEKETVGQIVDYGAQRAADYLTMKAHEKGDPDTVFDAQSVISLANTGTIDSTQHDGKNGPHRFKLTDLQEYIEKLYPKPSHALAENTQPTGAVGFMASGASTRTFKKYLNEDPFWLVSGLMLAAFSAGVGAILFIAPWLRTAIGDDYIHTEQPITSENVVKTESMLAATPVNSLLGKKIASMLTNKTGVFDRSTTSTDKDVLSLIKKTGPHDEIGNTLRSMVKNGAGPFQTVEQTVKLQFVKFSDSNNNTELEKVRNFNVGACKDDFEYGSTINIYAPLVRHRLMDPSNFSMYTFFAGAEVTFDCDREDGELPIIWINLEEFATSFSLDSVELMQTAEHVEAKVMVGLQPMVLIPFGRV